MTDHVALNLPRQSIGAAVLCALIGASSTGLRACEKLLNIQKTTARLATVVFFICACATANASSSDATTTGTTLAAATLAATHLLAACGDSDSVALRAMALATAPTSRHRTGQLVSLFGNVCADGVGRILLLQSNVDIRRPIDTSRGLAVAPRVLITVIGLPYANVIGRSSLGVAPSGDRGLIM